MSRVEKMARELCDEMMDEASKGGFESVMAAAVSIIEYSGYELARQGRPSSSIMLFQAARYLEERATAERRSRKTSQAQPSPEPFDREPGGSEPHRRVSLCS
ncbi:hypothetical protein RA2_00096 [Roseovarius sp. A-2]|nr:hypothetical protein RA2_00096 [Roseovarius sp. A-2]